MLARLQAWFAATPDETFLNWLFGAVVSATAAVLVLDYLEMSGVTPGQASVLPSAMPQEAPALSAPAALPMPALSMPTLRQGNDRRRGSLRAPDKALVAPMTFELVGDGRLLATGTITPGAAEAFAAEIGKRGGYVKTIVLHSPGGSVQDALKMGRLIREKKFDTEVESGGYCASSCPLVFAGGVERKAGDKAAIGVHQVFAVTSAPGASLADGMENAQRVTAQCQSYLRDMGVDLQVWLHAMETPKDQLFYFTGDELLGLKLATRHGKTAPRTAS